MAAVLVTLEKSAKGGMQKFFKYVPAVVLCYLIAMLLCTLGVWDMAETKPAYSALKNDLTYAMIFAMLLRCNIRKVLKLGPKMLIGFFSAILTIMIGFVCAFVLMKGTIGSDAWMGLGALCGSWIPGLPLSGGWISPSSICSWPRGGSLPAIPRRWTIWQASTSR